MSTISFDKVNKLPGLNVVSGTLKWAFYGGTHNDSSGNLVIPAGGYARTEVVGLENKTFAYYKTFIEAANSSINRGSNYKTDVRIKVDIKYKANSSDGEGISIIAQESANLNMTNVQVVSSKYRDTKVVDTQNLTVHTITFEIKNNTETDLTVYKLEMYASEDLGSSQFLDLYSKIQESNELASLAVGVDPLDHTILRYIKSTNASNQTKKFTPIYDGEYLDKIMINDGEKVIQVRYEEAE